MHGHDHRGGPADRAELAGHHGRLAQGPAAGTVDYAMAILAAAELEDDELEELVAVVSKTTGAGVRPLRARIKKERTERKAEARSASMDAEAKADGRIIRPRPEPDGSAVGEGGVTWDFRWAKFFRPLGAGDTRRTRAVRAAPEVVPLGEWQPEGAGDRRTRQGPRR